MFYFLEWEVAVFYFLEREGTCRSHNRRTADPGGKPQVKLAPTRLGPPSKVSHKAPPPLQQPLSWIRTSEFREEPLTVAPEARRGPFQARTDRQTVLPGLVNYLPDLRTRTARAVCRSQVSWSLSWVLPGGVNCLAWSVSGTDHKHYSFGSLSMVHLIPWWPYFRHRETLFSQKRSPGFQSESAAAGAGLAALTSAMPIASGSGFQTKAPQICNFSPVTSFYPSDKCHGLHSDVSINAAAYFQHSFSDSMEEYPTVETTPNWEPEGLGSSSVSH